MVLWLLLFFVKIFVNIFVIIFVKVFVIIFVKDLVNVFVKGFVICFVRRVLASACQILHDTTAPLLPQSTAAVVRTIWFFGGSPGFGQEVSALTLTAESQTWYRKYAPNVVKAYSAQGGCAFCRRPLASRCGYRQPVINSIFCSLMVWFGELLPRGFDIAWFLAVFMAVHSNMWQQYIMIWIYQYNIIYWSIHIDQLIERLID